VCVEKVPFLFHFDHDKKKPYNAHSWCSTKGFIEKKIVLNGFIATGPTKKSDTYLYYTG